MTLPTGAGVWDSVGAVPVAMVIVQAPALRGGGRADAIDGRRPAALERSAAEARDTRHRGMSPHGGEKDDSDHIDGEHCDSSKPMPWRRIR